MIIQTHRERDMSSFASRPQETDLDIRNDRLAFVDRPLPTLRVDLSEPLRVLPIIWNFVEQLQREENTHVTASADRWVTHRFATENYSPLHGSEKADTIGDQNSCVNSIQWERSWWVNKQWSTSSSSCRRISTHAEHTPLFSSVLSCPHIFVIFFFFAFPLSRLTNRNPRELRIER